MIPQIIWLALCFLAVSLSLATHGEPIKEPNTKHNGLIHIWRWAVTGGLMYWGGFFDPLFK
jgi:hypothetical protein